MLSKFHKLLIGSGLGLGVVFTGFSVARGQNAVAGISAGLTILVGCYLWWFVNKGDGAGNG